MNDNAQQYLGNERILLPLFPRLVHNALMHEGFSERALFQGLDFGPKDLLDDKFRLSLEQHEAFILRVLDLTDDLHYVVKLVQSDSTSFETIVSLAALNCSDVRQAITVVARYLKLVTRVLSIAIKEDNQQLYYEINSHLKDDRVFYFAVTAFTLLLDKILYDSTQDLHVIDTVTLNLAEPPGFSAIKAKLPFQVQFSAEHNRLTFNNRDLDGPIKKSDLISTSLFVELAERQLLEAEAEQSVISALRALLLKQIQAPPKLDAAAAALGHSPRNLRRKLEEAGTTYQTVLNSVRFSLAKKMLDEQKLSITEIAFELGFKNVSDFGRNFRKLSGSSPSDYRAGSQ